MSSFDVVSQIDYQEILNSINGVQKEIGNRYDFKSVKWSLDLDKKEKQLIITAESDYCLGQIQNSLKGCFIRRGLDPRALDFKEPEKAAGNSLKEIVKIKEGIEQEISKKITKAIKDSKIKVQASIQGQELRISGKNRDDLQETIQLIKNLSLDLPLQYINFRD
ncbi:MAG: YajQ family cyclic di-GMP-binding protein [Rickettsiales bacterium]|nr:YajQ family cyclic di-GMP-binding protein [Rickettsiales bacterium]